MKLRAQLAFVSSIVLGNFALFHLKFFFFTFCFRQYRRRKVQQEYLASYLLLLRSVNKLKYSLNVISSVPRVSLSVMSKGIILLFKKRS